nr:MAG TPA: hypothetical protein [Caudoviricetes sp.]DAX37353.1 MAG TPA: hypothetical protein [Caudoviricetes sp.]
MTKKKKALRKSIGLAHHTSTTCVLAFVLLINSIA